MTTPATAGRDENGLTQIMGREDRNHGVEFETTSVADLVFYTVHVISRLSRHTVFFLFCQYNDTPLSFLCLPSILFRQSILLISF